MVFELIGALVYFFLVGLGGERLWVRLLGPRLGRALSVPLSLATLVVVGSIVLSGAPLFWPVFLAVIVGLGWVGNTVGAVRNWRAVSARRLPFMWVAVGIGVGAAIAVVFSSYFGAITHLSPAQIDTHAHVENLRALGVGPHNTSYPIGHYALLQPLTFLVSGDVLYRFVGPAFGVLVAFAAFRVARMFVSWEWAAAVVALLSSAAFNVLSVLRASLLPSALSLILILAMVTLLIAVSATEEEDDSTVLRPMSIAYVVLIAALGLAVPYSLVSYSVALGAFLVVALSARWISLGRSVSLVLVTVAGPFVWPAFRLFRSAVGLSSEVFAAGGILTGLAGALPAAPLVGSDEVFTNSIAAIVREFLEFKYLRSPFESALSLGAYVLVLAAGAVLILGWSRFSLPVKAMAIVVLAYGIALQTGFSELLSYRGRAGWYLMVFGPFLAVMAIRELRGAWSESAAGPLWRSLPALIVGFSIVSLVVIPPTGEHRMERFFAGVASVKAGLAPGQEFEVVSDVRYAEQLDLLGGVAAVKPWDDVPGCPASDAVAVLDFAPDLGQTYLFEAARSGEDVRTAEDRERSKLAALVEDTGELEQRLQKCGFSEAFSRDGVVVLTSRG